MEKIVKDNMDWINAVWQKIDSKLKKVAVRSRDKLPYTTVDGIHNDMKDSNPNWWTNGFFGGLMWLMYVGTKDETYKITAERQEELLDRALKNYDMLDHDVGFMWELTSGVNFRLFGSKQSKVRTMYAASTLASRYNLKGGFIRAWNGDNNGWTIIDCMMNVPMLYFASRITGDDRYKHIAMAHADMTIRDHIREDGSVVHIVSHDTETGDVIETFGGQGMADGSSWSRGQAWALYGFILSYIHTGEKRYLDTAKKVAHYFISCVCDDWLPRCDFRSPDEPVIYDTTAAACAACGLIEIANNVPEYEKKLYLSAAIKILKAQEEHFANWNEDEDNLLEMGTERYPSVEGAMVHLPIIYGDYFFAEAIYKLRETGILFW